MMEPFLTDEEEDLITDLLVRYEDVLDETGKELSAEELCVGYPHLTAEVEMQIAKLRTIAWTKDDPGRPLTDDLEAQKKDLSGTVLGERYRLDEFIGSGGYGSVYRAEDLKLRRNVAVKIGHRQTMSDLLLDEARRVAKLKHSGIVAVHDCGTHDSRIFLVFEFVEGEDLAQACRSKKLMVRQKVEIVEKVAESLAAAHALELIHRDIKPENILVQSSGEVLLTDFGVGCTLNDVVHRRVGTSGTLPYQPPEVLSGDMQLLDGRCDVYGLGVVLFELLAGKSPFESSSKTELREQILFRQPKRLKEIDSSLPVELDAICSKAMAKHPSDRHESIGSFAKELRGWLASTTPNSRRRWLRLLGLLLVVMAVVGTVVGVASLWPNDISMVRDDVLLFGGHTRIVTDVQPTLPMTLEAWLRPDPYHGQSCQFIIGSDIPGEYGLGLAICGSMLSVEYVEGMVNSSTPVPPSRWSHVAVVFAEDEIRLYFNGKLIKTAPPSRPGGDTRFVIGNAGESNLIDFYRGRIRSLRISEGERYSSGFVPTEIQNDVTDLLTLDVTIRCRDDKVTDQDGRCIGKIERF